MKLPFDQPSPLLGIYPEDIPLTIQKLQLHKIILPAVFARAKYWKKMPIYRRVIEPIIVVAHNGGI